jgi:ubiquinone/menaquinone biosynthesis C-methylase UbiE
MKKKTINCEEKWNEISNMYARKDINYNSFPFNVLKRYKNIRFLEAGSGDGETAIFMSKLGNKVIGIEIADNFLKMSNKKINRLKIKNIKFIKGDVRKMPFKDNYFDLIFSGGVIEHFNETFESLKEHIRILKKNGHILIGVPCKQGLHYPLKKIMQFLGIWNIGFEKSFSKQDFKKKLIKNNLKILEEFYIPIEATSSQTNFRYKITKVVSVLDTYLGGTHMMYFLCAKR